MTTKSSQLFIHNAKKIHNYLIPPTENLSSLPFAVGRYSDSWLAKHVILID